MKLIDKLKLFERQMVFMRWGVNEGYGRINYVGYDFLEFEVFDADALEFTDKILINSQLLLEIVVKGTDISRILAEYSNSLPVHESENN